MKKLLTILTLLVCVVLQAWADERPLQLWPETSYSLTWEEYCIKDIFSNVTTGAELSFTYTSNSGSPQLQVWHKDGSYNGTQMSVTTTESSTFKVTISTDTELEDIKARGIYIKGQDATITQISYTPNGGNPTTLWPETSYAISWSERTLLTSTMSSLSTGDGLRVTFTKSADSPQMQLQHKNESWSATDLFNDNITEPSYTVILSETAVADIKARGLTMKGQNATVTKIEAVALYTLTVTSSNEEYGIVTVETTALSESKYVSGTEVSVKAEAKAGYRFVNWTDNNNSDAAVSTDATYTFSISANTSLKANFEAESTHTDKPEVNVSAFSAMTSENNTPNFSDGTLTTTAAWTGIQQWIGDNSGVQGSQLVVKTESACKLKIDVYYTDNTQRSLTVPETAISTFVLALEKTKYIKSIQIQNSEVGIVKFTSIALDPLYTITATSADTDKGTAVVKTDPTSAGKYAYGTSVTVTATPVSGYSFSQWKVGETSVSTDASYTFTATEDVALTAEFAVGKTTQALKNATQKMVNETVGTKVLISNSAFANVTAGDIITVNMSEVATSGAFIVLKENTSGTSFFGNNYSSALISGQTSFTHTLTASDITLLTGDNKALCITGEGFTCGNITITSAGNITADAAHTTMYVLNVTQPSNGTIQIGGSDAAAQKAYDNGSQVTLTAAPESGYAISGWTKDETAAGSEETLTVTFDGADISVTAAFAESATPDPNTLWEGTQAISWTETHLTGDGFSSLTAGSVLRVSLTNTNTEYTSLQIWAKDSEGANDTQVTEYSATKTVYEFYVTESLLSKVKNGLYIKGEATITLTKIEKVTDALISFTPGEGETVIDYTQAVMQDGWSKSLMVGVSNFQSANAGDILTVYLSGVNSGTISLSSNNTGLSDASNNGKSLEGAATTYTLTLTESDVTALKANELRITGQGFTVTGVTLKAGEVADPNVLWEGSQAISWTETHLTGDGFSGLTAGTVLRVSLTNTNTEYTSLQIWVKDSEGANDTQVTEYSATKTVYEFYVTEGLLSKVKNGLYIKGDATITLTKIEKVTDVLVGFTPGEGETVIDYTQAVMQDGWAKSLLVGTSNFQSANAGDILTVYLSGVSSGTISLSSNNEGLSDASSSGKSLEDAATTYTVALTESDVTALKANELRITGQGFTVTGVTLKAGEDTNRTFTTSVTPTGSGTVTVKLGNEDGTVTTDTEFPQSTQLTAIAAANEGYQFVKWQLPDGTTAATTAAQTVTLEDNIEFIAVFEAKATTLAELESRTLWENLDGQAMSWDEICVKDATWGAILEKNEEIQVTVSAKTSAEWPKVILRDASSEEITNTLMNDVSEYPYVVKFTLTTDFLTKMTNGFKISGDGVTITKVALYKPAAVTPVFDENGKMDLSKFASDGTAGYSYADGKGTITTGEGQTYKGVVVNLGSDDYVSGTKMIFKFQSETSAQIHVNYVGEEWADGAQVSTTGTVITVPLDGSKQVNRIDIQLWNEKTTAVLTEVSISNKCTLTVSAANGTVAVKNGETTTTATEFDYGTSLTLTATPASSDYSFKQWVIGETTKTDNPYTFTITGDTEITAEFKSADEDVIWLGSQEINWNTGTSQTIAVTEENNLKIDDQLVFSITPAVEGIEWPQLQLSSKSDGTPVLIGTANTAIDENTTEVKYYVTKAMLNDITTNGGFIVSGAVFTLTKVRIERGNGGEGYENAVWIGEKTYPSNWSVYTTIGKDLFANATVGQVIRMKYKDVKTGAALSFSYDDNGWKTLPDAASVTPSGLATKLTITEDMLAALKTGGLIISGVNFTLTSVDLLNASDVKVLTSTVPVTGDDWVWTSSETPEFKVNIENGNNEAVTAEAILMIKTDKLANVTTLTQNKEMAANGSGTITFTYKPNSAGFYNATVIVNDETVRSFNFGYAPTEIVSAADKQNDFDSYWAAAKSQLADVEASDTPVLTEMTEKSTSKRKVYLVEFKSIPDGTSGDPVTVRGYYCEPTDGVTHPVLMHYQGYDSFTYGPGGTAPDVYCPSGDDNPDYAEFVLSTRGQALNNRDPYKSNGGNPYGQDGWFKANFGDKDSYYYRGAYMDVVRAIDFMATRSTSDMENLFAEGQSQGGAFTYAAAALSGRTFKAIAPAITFMGDFPDYFELASWPGNEAKEKQAELGWTDAQLYAFMSYYDTKNLATKVSCPVITSIGVQDNVCPPHTNIAPYNNVTTEAANKQVIFNAELQHATNSEWNTVMMNFFSKYNTWVDPNSTKLEVEEKRTLWTGSENLGTNWPKVAEQSATVGGILEEGEKFLITVSSVAEDATDIQVTVRSADYEHTLGFSKFDDISSYPVEVKLILSAGDVEAFKNGFHITGKNCTVAKVVLYKPTAVNRTERTLLEKKQAVGEGIEINRGLFSNAAEEDVLKVYFEVADGVTAKINLEDMDYQGIENSWPELTTSPYAYTFTATALKKIQDSGMRIRGENFTFLKATLYTEKELGEAISDGDDDEEDDISNADASEETKKLFSVLKNLYGKKIVSGVVANIDWNTTEAENVYKWTGKYPAMNVYDYINLHASKDVNAEGWVDYSDISTAKNWWKEGGIVGAMWHWQMKANNGTDYTCTPGTAADETSFDASKVYVDGTSENTLAKQQLDQLCGYLKKMQDAGIPVVWRPLHEGSGNVEQFSGGTAWFWWGTKGADVYKKLWQWMYNYMVKTKGLNNLIWVWTSQTGDKDWYPGDAYVDIIGRDNYGATAAGLATEYEDLQGAYPNKMITLSECGNSDDDEMATLSSIWNAGSRWSWFMTWYDSDYNEGKTTTHKHTSETWWKDAIAKDYVVTRDQMKELLGQASSDDSQTGVNISLDDLNEGWSSTYNSSTKTITTEGEWAARGWYIGDDRYNSKGSITVKYEAVTFGVTLKMEYTNTSGDSKSVSAGAAAGETEVELDIPADVKTIEKVYITYQPVGKLVLTDATVNDKVVDNRTEKTLAEKEAKIADGDIKINRGLFSNAAAKDVIRIYATGLSDASKIALEPGDYSGAIDGANWTAFTESPFELKLTETVLATIKEKGLLVRGENFTFTKATLYTEKDLGSEISDGGNDESGDSGSSESSSEETIFDKKDGEADLSKLVAQDESTTTVNYNKSTGEITITTTEPYKAAQIWFNTPEEVTGNVLNVEIAETGVNVTVTVGYTDGTESMMSSTFDSNRTRAMTRAAFTTIAVPLDPGKEVQKIEVKNTKAGTITIKSITMTTKDVFEAYKADLTMLKPQSGATYDVMTFTLATTKGWTGATLTTTDKETVKGAELVIRFTDNAKVKVAVKYRDNVEGPNTIMEESEAVLRLALDPSKAIQEISIQPTEAAIITFSEIAVYPAKGMGGLLSEGETLEIWKGNETLSWNEIAHQKANIGSELQEYDEILVTVSAKAAGNDWPKVFLRDANSEQVGNEVLLNEIASFPYVVRFVITKSLLDKLKNGFCICGDGVTVTKVELYRPYAPKKGDIHLRALEYGYGSEYDAATNTITTTQRWAARGWEIGDSRYNNKDMVLVQFEAVDFPVTLKMEYVDAYGQKQATSAGVAGGNTEVRLAIPSGIKQMDRAYIIFQSPGSLTLTNAEVITAVQAGTRGISQDSRGISISGGNSLRPDGSRNADDDAWYTLSGQRIDYPTAKGIYIHQGKTVVIQ